MSNSTPRDGTIRDRSGQPVHLGDRLAEGEQAGRWRYLGIAGGIYQIDLDVAADGTDPGTASVRSYGAGAMWAWLNGLECGHTAGPGRRPGRAATFRAEIADMLRVLTDPTDQDRRRAAVRAALHHADLTVKAAAGTVGRDPSNVRKALHWSGGPPLTSPLVDALLDVCRCVIVADVFTAAASAALADVSTGAMPTVGGIPVKVATLAAPRRPRGRRAGPPLPEPPGLVRMRLLAACHLAGIIRLDGPRDPDEAYRARTFTVTVPGSGRRADVQRRVHADVLAPWLQGVADARRPEVAVELAAADVTDAAAGR